MLNNKQFDYFSVLVIGKNPEEQISKYDDMSDSEPYILYQYKDRSKFRKIQIEIYKKYLSSVQDLKERNLIIDKITDLKKMSDDEFYLFLSELHQFDESKNIVTTDNPDGKWVTCEQGGRMFSDKLKDLKEMPISSCKKNEIDWNSIHLNTELCNTYKRTWELCVEKQEPKSVTDITIVNNMKHVFNYFENFTDKEQYIKYNTSFFTNVVIINGEWFDMEDTNSSDWIINYFDKFISNLKDDELITIFECTK